jgi:hypothetical protein
LFEKSIAKISIWHCLKKFSFRKENWMAHLVWKTSGFLNLLEHVAQTDLRLSLVKTDISKAKISYSGASLFNSLPADLKLYGLNSSFTRKRKEFFLQLNHNVQRVDEFSCTTCKHVVLYCQCFGNRS